MNGARAAVLQEMREVYLSLSKNAGTEVALCLLAAVLVRHPELDEASRLSIAEEFFVDLRRSLLS